MPTFIDESGETGTGEGSSHYYILAAVYFDDKNEFEAYEEVAKTLKNKHKKENHKYEFKSSKSHENVKIEYFSLIKNFEFWYAASYIDKRQFARLNKQDVLNHTIAGLAGLLEDSYLKAEAKLPINLYLNEPIRYDDLTDKLYVSMLKDRFRSIGKTQSTRGRLIGDIKGFASHTNFGIQLADMVCGAVADHLKGSSKYYNLIGDYRRLGLFQAKTHEGDQT